MSIFICHVIDCMACNILNRKSPGRWSDIGMIVSRKPSLYMTRHCCTQVVLYWFYSNELCKFVELAWLHTPRAEKNHFPCRAGTYFKCASRTLSECSWFCWYQGIVFGQLKKSSGAFVPKWWIRRSHIKKTPPDRGVLLRKRGNEEVQLVAVSVSFHKAMWGNMCVYMQFCSYSSSSEWDYSA